MSEALTPGTPEYMQGLVSAARLIEEAADVLTSLGLEGVLAKLDQVQQLLGERILWPSFEDEKQGMYCSDCGLVVYSEQLVGKCPRCGSFGWYMILPNWQPKVQYGRQPRKVCKCGTIVYGDEEVCPICRGKL